jgi:outer membrane protein assembly factor BamE (lipoprotein component of BamABCDE complex)
MKYFFLLLVFLLTLNCSLNKVSNAHGSKFIDAKYDKIILNKSNKNDVRKLIGPPSSISKFDGSWFFIERKKTNQSLFKMGKQKIISNNIIILEFNNMGIVSNKKFLNLNDMKDIKIAEKITKKKFAQDNKIYDILSSLREKINAPTKRSK